MTTITMNSATTDTMTPDTLADMISVVTNPGESQETLIEFRKEKFADHITPELAANLIPVVQDFNKKSEMAALGLLWKLTINPTTETLKVLRITTVNAENAESPEQLKEAETLIFMPSSIISRFRNELRYQYSVAHPGFPKVDYPESCTQAYKALNNATVKDHITCAVILSHCKSVIENRTQKEIDRAINLLTHPKEPYAYGGVRTLSFHAEEADYLKRYAPQIGDLLKALDEDKQSYMTPASSENDDGNRPFADLAKQVKEKGFTLSENSSDEPGTPPDEDELIRTSKVNLDRKEDDILIEDLPSSSFDSEPLSIETILAHQNIIGTFLNTFQQLEDLGIDPFAILSKGDAITKIIEGIHELS